MRLSPNFTLEELTASQTADRKGLDNTPNATAIANLTRLAALLEQVRALVGKPIFITSGYRSPEVNLAIGSTNKSQHPLGCAADFKVPGLTPKQVVELCIKADIPYHQIIEEFASWVHISVPNTASEPPKKQALIIDRNGTRPFQ
jgi:zinc D-Ala-D-Ala carboxypeptidase